MRLDRFFTVICDLCHCIGSFRSGRKFIQGILQRSEYVSDSIEGFRASLGWAVPILAICALFCDFGLDINSVGHSGVMINSSKAF